MWRHYSGNGIFWQAGKWAEETTYVFSEIEYLFQPLRRL